MDVCHVLAKYARGSWRNWKPGMPAASNERWSVPPVSRIVSVCAVESSKASSQARKMGRTASLDCM